MNHNLTSIAGKFAPAVALAAFSLMGAAQAYATDLGEIEIGKTYQIEDFQPLTGYYIARETGTLVATGYPYSDIRFYTDEAHTDALEGEWNGQWGTTGTMSFQVEQGHTYYLYNRMVMNGGEIRFDDGQSVRDLTVSWIVPDPAREPIYDLGHNSDIQVQLSQPDVTFDGVDFTYVDRDGFEQTSAWTRVRVSGDILVISGVADRLTQLLKSDNMLPGNSFSFTVKNIASSQGATLKDHENGDLRMEYRVSGIPVNVIAQKWPSDFLSYWPAGDPDGIASITFTDQINPEMPPQCYISCGNLEGDLGIDYFREDNVPCRVDGNTVYIDLTGVRRTMDDMFVSPPTGSNDRVSYDVITVGITNLYDMSGVPVQTPGQGTLGSVFASLPYKEIAKGAVSMEATPANGSDLENGNVEIWYSGIKNFRFSGFNVTYEKDGETITEVIAPEQVTENLKADGSEGTYSFTISENAWKGKNVTITPADYATLDGYDYTSFLTVRYNGFALLLLDPQDDSSFALLTEGQEIGADFNYASKYPEMYVMYQIKDLNAEDPDKAVIRTLSWMDRLPSGIYTAVIPRTLRLYKGHVYEVLFQAWESETAKNNGEAMLGEAVAHWNGLTVPYTFSETVFESIDPAEGTVLTAEDRVFTLKFDGTVHLDATTTFINRGQGHTEPFESIEAVGDYVSEDENVGTMSPEWKLTVPATYMEELGADLVFTVVATDAGGLRVQGNMGEEEGTYFYFSYEVQNAYVAVDVEPGDGAIVSTVDSFTVASELGLSYSWQAGSIKLLDADGNTVATVKDVEDLETAADDEYTVVKVKVIFDNNITEDGVYTLVMEKGAFSVGEGFESWQSAAQTLTWTLKYSSVEEGLAETAELYTVFNLQGIRVLENADADAVRALAPGIYVVNGKKTVVR